MSDQAVAQQLAWERRLAPAAAVAAVLGGVLTLGGNIFAQTAAYKDVPVIGELQALTPALEGQVEPAVNPRTTLAQFFADHGGTIIFAGVLTALGALAVGCTLLYLFRATRARRPELPALAQWVVVAGAGLMALNYVLQPVFRTLRAQDYLDAADRSRDAIDAALAGGPLVVIGALGLAGQLALALAFVLVCLNAMRAGLLTRFMGVLGIVVGVLYVIPFGQLPVVQVFWMIALAPLFLLRWPNGNPPAWTSGQAEPWPSAAELREQRMAAAERDKAAKPSKPAPAPRTLDAGDDDAAEPTPVPQGAAQRKRRKRRR